MNELILMAHVGFGMACLISTVWIYVEVLNVSPANEGRIRRMSLASAAFMWISFLFAGYWYVTLYQADKAIILKGPWPFAHNFVMETKEHLVIILLMLATYLPIVTAGNLRGNHDARRITLWVAGLVILMALLMEGEGAVIAMGVKAGLLAR